MADYLDKDYDSQKNTAADNSENPAADDILDKRSDSGNEEEANSGHAGHGSHRWMLILCSLIMVVGFLAISGRIPWLGSSGWMIVLLCPLMHFAMMFAMKNDSQG